MKSNRCRENGFTLTELLVVIVIISVLATITAYATLKVRESANNAVATANMRQLGTAMLSYLSDHSQKFPDRRNGPNWHRRLLPYLGFTRELKTDSDCTPENAPDLARVAAIFADPNDKIERTGNGYKRSFTTLAWTANANGGRFGKSTIDEGARYVWVSDPSKAAMLIQNYSPESLVGQGNNGYKVKGSPVEALGRTETVIFADGHAEEIPTSLSADEFKQKYWPLNRR